MHGRSAPNDAAVYANLAERTGYVQTKPGCLPYGLTMADEIGENEAVLVALWNNAAFQEALADLGIARGDLIQAGLLPNPEVVWLFGMPDKPFRYLVDFPLETLWLRPIRVRAAQREADRVSQRLTQLGLDLIRDTRQAFADSVLARGRLQVAEDAVRIRGEVARFAEIRLKAGDASVQEAATAKIDADQARQDLARIQYDAGIADQKLRWLLGIGERPEPLKLDVTPPPERFKQPMDGLVDIATASRPDALAAEQNAAAARERLRIAKIGWVRFLGIADATAGDRTGHEFGPGLRATLPVLNWNQGTIARFEAELQKANRQKATVHNQIVNDVGVAYLRYCQSRDELKVLDERVRPEAEAAIRRAEAAYKEGNTPYVVVLETTRQLLDSRLRRFVLQAELRKTWAELERSVGRRLVLPTVMPTTLPQPVLMFQEDAR